MFVFRIFHLILHVILTLSYSIRGFKFAELEMSQSFVPFLCLSDPTTYTTNSRNFPEVVLSTLVRNFRFELPVDKKLAWKLGGIVSPGVENDPIPKLPLRVSQV